MDIERPIRLLLLDLDGVVVFEASPPLVLTRELLLLHDDAENSLAGLSMPIVILTHRSRREAKLVLDCAGLHAPLLLRVVAAEDLFFEAIRTGKVGQLLKGGLLKSLALPLLERELRIPRTAMALVDDRMINLLDVIGHGIGRALLAPFSMDRDGQLTSFDMLELGQLLADYGDSISPAAVGRLTPMIRQFAKSQRTGMTTDGQSRHLFNRLRRVGFRLRRRLVAQSPKFRKSPNQS